MQQADEHGRADAGKVYTVSAVEKELRKSGRYLLYLDEQQNPSLSVHEDVLIHYRLFKGATIAAGLLAEIRQADLRQHAYALALSYLGRKARTRQELVGYLLRKEVAEETAERVADRLEAERTLDDAEYAARFARSRLRTQGKGRRAIAQELRQRGVSRQQTEEALSAIDEDVEREMALQLARKKWPRLSGESRERLVKLQAFLARRGYAGELVRSVARTTVAEAALDDEGR